MDMQSDWAQIQKDIRQRWSSLSDTDLNRVKGSPEALTTVIVERYHVSHEDADRQVHDFLDKEGVSLASGTRGSGSPSRNPPQAPSRNQPESAGTRSPSGAPPRGFGSDSGSGESGRSSGSTPSASSPSASSSSGSPWESPTRVPSGEQSSGGNPGQSDSTAARGNLSEEDRKREEQRRREEHRRTEDSKSPPPEESGE